MEKVANNYLRVNNSLTKYTLCFCVRNDLVLMLYRINDPNKNLWNGLGGKIEAGENPFQSVKREMQEEANIDLNQANTHFAGIVTWNKENEGDKSLGMYVFIVDLPSDWAIWKGNRPTSEGALAWKSIGWASNVDNTEVVENIPHFLPPMLRNDPPVDYHFVYRSKQIISFSSRSIPIEVRSFSSDL